MCSDQKDLKRPDRPYLPDQAFTVQEAIDSFTTRSAEGSFEENFKGRIAPGMAADFVVLDQNLFEIPGKRYQGCEGLRHICGR